MGHCIEVTNMSKRYGDHLAVDRVSFTVSPGEVFGFLGPNGAGKTTTQRILTGLLKPSGGSVWILDHDMASDPLGAKEHIGVVPETANPYTELSGWKNLLLSGAFYGLGGEKMKSRAEELLREFQLWDSRRQLVKNYSKGMKQRLVLAMALLHRPQVLFLDEPTAGLDVESRRLIHEKVKILAAKGVAVFYTTHHIDEASDLCSRVAIIRQGRIIAMDRPEVLKAAFQENQSVLAAFDQTVDAGNLRQIFSVHRAEKEGDKLRLYSSDPGRVIFEVVDFARQNNLNILSLNTMTPSLEDVFVALTHGDGSLAEAEKKE